MMIILTSFRDLRSRCLRASMTAFALALATTAQAAWIQKADMAFPRGEHANVVYNNKIYVLGGISNHATGPNQMEVYDPATDTWTPEGALPPNRYRHHITAGSSLYNGPRGPEIWICGGKPGAPNTGTVWVDVYHIGTKTWSRGPDLPEKHWAGPAVIVGNKLHVLTGGKGRFLSREPSFCAEPRHGGVEPQWGRHGLDKPSAGPAAAGARCGGQSQRRDLSDRRRI